MTRLERYREKLRQLENRRNELMRSGRYLKSAALNEDIRELEKVIKEAEDYEESCRPKPLKDMVSKEELDEMGIVPLMIEAHLAADFLTAISYMVLDTCKRHGFERISLMPDLKELIKKSEMFSGFLLRVSPELRDLLTRNDTLVNAVHKKYMSYIGQRLK